MKVVLETLGNHDEGPDAITVLLDSGEVLNSWCIVGDAEKERDSLERCLLRLVDSETIKIRAENEKLRHSAKAMAHAADSEKADRVQFLALWEESKTECALLRAENNRLREELEMRKADKKPKSTFQRDVPYGPGSEYCGVCTKHISRHYGGTECRCYPLHEGELAADKESKVENAYCYELDQIEYYHSGPTISGLEIKMKVHGWDPTWSLYVEQEPNEMYSQPLADSEIIDLSSRRLRFYSLPPASF